ncbi:MAG: crossover junction endodeoxyribonuclease RuvC [Phycisphaerae bacterium]|nr:crossover junction endodeoxyribonuclease RuvC [Phycisphaerae bacterium]
MTPRGREPAPRRRVLGIDPGLQRTGYACVETDEFGLQARLVEAGVIRLKQGTPLSARLRQLDLELADAITDLAPSILAVESVFTHHKNLRTAILMAHARGVVLLAGQRAGLSFVEFPPATVKKAMTGNGNASKRQMQVAVAAEFGLAKPPEPPDVADAIAIALAGARRS